MGWGKLFFVGEVLQQLDMANQKREIANLRDELRTSRGSAGSAGGDIASLQAENDELRLYLTAIVRLLISKGMISQEEMKQVVDVVDAEDGVRDGRYKGRVE
ncbi:MAG TPA: hypothetical protein VMV94_10025 [Phycisphaerae bacterium]|nr:hypothetical protein [Phycisphaerae bacterium]